jgi:hypothetical protein
MPKIIKQRMTVQVEGDFVIFLIGMRVNKWWKINKWFPVVMAMPRMLKELYQKPESGFLGAQSGFGVIVQYWKSFEQLEAYAKDRDAQHYPAWKAFNTRMKGNADVGIWHETYKVRAGEYECIYNNMPPYGLGKVGELIPAIGRKEYARDRITKGS